MSLEKDILELFEKDLYLNFDTIYSNLCLSAFGVDSAPITYKLDIMVKRGVLVAYDLRTESGELNNGKNKPLIYSLNDTN